MMELLAAGRLSKKCPNCGTVEAASRYCTRCLTKTGDAYWFVQSRGRPASGHESAPKKAPRGQRRYPAPNGAE